MSQALAAIKQRVADQIVHHAHRYNAIRLDIARTAIIDIADVDDNNIPQVFLDDLRDGGIVDVDILSVRHLSHPFGKVAADPVDTPATSVSDDIIFDAGLPLVKKGEDWSDRPSANERFHDQHHPLYPDEPELGAPTPEDVVVDMHMQPLETSGNVEVSRHMYADPMDLFAAECDRLEKLGHAIEFDSRWGSPRKGYKNLSQNKRGVVGLKVSRNTSGQLLAIRTETDADGRLTISVLYERHGAVELSDQKGIAVIEDMLVVLDFFNTPLRGDN